MVTHWDEVEGVITDVGDLRGTWRRLGRAAGTIGVGANRIDLPPGGRSTPVHTHTAEEEIFFVLGGSGLSWQDGKTYEVGAGDCLVHLACESVHTLVAGPEGIDALAFGMRAYPGGTWLPRAGVVRMPPAWAEAPGGAHPWEREIAAGELELPEPEAERPSLIVHVDEVEEEAFARATVGARVRYLGRAAGSLLTGLRRYELEPGKLGAPPHCHSAEEEIFVVLEGEGTLLLGDDEHPVRRGSVVARPPGTRVAHAFRAGEQGLVYLAYGTREPNDIAFYPRSGKVYLRGVGVIGRLEPLDYWDGEE